MKTTRNKTAGGARSTSRKPTNSGKDGHKTPPRSKSRASTKAQLKNRPTIPQSLGNLGELVAQSYQESGTGQTWARHTSLNPAKVEEMIQELSDLREVLAPQVPDSIPAGKRMFCTPEPLWKISDEVRDDGKALAIRHPGIGWIGFIIPHDDCRRLAKKLTGKLG